MLQSINIISKSALYQKGGGPLKVFNNALLGFQNINQPYTINQPLFLNKYNWIHDDPYAFIEAAISKIPCIAGPNLFALPSDFPKYIPSIEHIIFLHPAQWCTQIWKEMNYSYVHRIRTWPVGIDYKGFIVDTLIRDKRKVLLYFKKRKSISKDIIYKILATCDLEPIALEYGNYNESEYKYALEHAWFGIWIGTTESQGIALQEALASGLPLIVLENSNMLDHETNMIDDMPQVLSKFKGTTIPYWDNRCGIVINSIDEIPEAIHSLLVNYNTFDPTSFIKENLTLEKQANVLLNFFNDLDFSNYTSGKKPSSLKNITISAIQYNYKFKNLANRIRRKMNSLHNF